MNQQFKQLAQDAGMYVDLDGAPWPKWMGAEECEAAYEKFAELIVRECADIVDNHGRWILYDKLAVKIKREFGVE